MTDPDPQLPEREVDRLRTFFVTGATRSISWRVEQLQGLRALLENESDRLLHAIAADLGRPALESWITEIWLVDREIAFLQRHIRRWSRPRRVPVPLVQRPGRARFRREPYGVSLVIAPWNYPVQLTLLPLASGLAAGNCVAIKPSELTPSVATALATMLPRYLSPQAVSVITGGERATVAAIESPVDHVFFTGSAPVGRKILEAAAPQLTPVVLELGGKCPAVVAADADLEMTAKRIVFGKFTNAGQTCVAPDYVLVERAVASALVERLVATILAFYGQRPSESADYGRIVSDHHHRRLRALLDTSDGQVIGGASDPADRFFAPTIVVDPSPDSPVMTEEIFGPILPVVTVATVDDAVEFIERRAQPLAVYCFTGSTETAERVERSTTSGAFCQNTTIEHLAIPGLPFGGVGASGSGSSHGRAGFDAFSRPKSVLNRRSFHLGLADPPFSARRRKLLARLLRGPRGTFPPG